MKKITIYRIILLTLLSTIIGLTIFFVAKTSQAIKSYEDKSDVIMFLICDILLIIFIGLEIFNTMVSIYKGSSFISHLVYNEDNAINKFVLIVAGLLLIFSTGSAIYFCLRLYNIGSIFTNFSHELNYLIISFSLTLFVDSLSILTYPLVSDIS